MDRKLFFSYIQNMQQNNQDMVGFQNSMRKNSWQKPKSIYEMNGGGHVYQGDFDREDAARQLGRDADKQRSDLSKKSFERIMDDVRGIAAKAHEEWLANDGTGHPFDTFGKEESTDYFNGHPNWNSLSKDAKDDVLSSFMDHLGDIHNDHLHKKKNEKSKLKEQTEEDAMIDQYEADREGEISADERLANIRHRESMGTKPSHPETVMDAAEALVRAYDAFKLEQEKIKAAPPGPAWPDNRPEHFKKSKK